MGVASTFRDLNVCKLASKAAAEIYGLTKAFPKEELFSLTDQIRRSSRASKAMIAEAWARRRYKAVFINKIDEALGEATETQSWLDDALRCRYLTTEKYAKLEADYRSITAMLSRMIDRASDFCKNAPYVDYRVRDELSEADEV